MNGGLNFLRGDEELTRNQGAYLVKGAGWFNYRRIWFLCSERFIYKGVRFYTAEEIQQKEHNNPNA